MRVSGRWPGGAQKLQIIAASNASRVLLRGEKSKRSEVGGGGEGYGGWYEGKTQRPGNPTDFITFPAA